MGFLLGVVLVCAVMFIAWFGYSQAQARGTLPNSGVSMSWSTSSQVSPTELRYRLIERFGEPFYCDPDLYPVARDVTIAVVRERVQSVGATDPERLRIVAIHLGIADPAVLTDDQARGVYDELKRLDAVTLESLDGQYRFRIRVAGDGRQGSAIAGVIDSGAAISNVSSEPDVQTCPRCLDADTAIDTPNGAVLVKHLRKGMLVWTMDRDGTRRPAAIVATVEQHVPRQHDMLHVALSDGRTLRVSPGHPIANGKPIADVAPGDFLDGAWVVAADRTRYQESATYDILPAGDTGRYWANGILLGSTLAEHPVTTR
jgi:hypothetical protein